MKHVRIGCSGWGYDSWRSGIYKGVPPARWLERYAEVFDTVEVNNTFYRLVKRKAVEGWVERTPPGFLFAVKGSRYLTHMKRLRGIEQGLARFWEPLEPLRESGKLGPVLWQLPGNFHRDDAVLAAALELLPPAPPLLRVPPPELVRPGGARAAGGPRRLARHPRPRRTPAASCPSSAGGRVAYLRLHHGARGRNGNYSATELDHWRRRIAAWRSRREVFAYLNNDWEEFAPPNAISLRQGLSLSQPV